MAAESELTLTGIEADKRRTDYVSLLESFPYRPTLFLGIGGTGGLSVAKVKSLFLDLVAPGAQAGRAAVGPAIDQLYSFLAFDTDEGGRPSLLSKDKEWFHLGVRDLNLFYTGMGKHPFFKDWLVKGFPQAALMAGASGYRNLGRLALMANIDVVHREIIKKKLQILTAASGLKTQCQQPIVFVFCSLSGGTGSGMLLDICFSLREIFGTTPGIIGLVGVMDGLPTRPDEKKRDTRVNTFCGLKELNAFMSGQAEGFAVGQGERIEYPLGVCGRLMAPLDECYLVSPTRADGANNLPDQAALTSFLARFVFMMSAFSFRAERDEQTPDYAGVMVDNRTSLTKEAAGARLAYLVPGLAQAHFPVGTVANLFALEAARGYLKLQAGGTAPAGEQAAKDFVAGNRLDYRSLRDRVAIRPGDPRSAPLAAVSYDVLVAEMVESEQRYEHGDDVLRLGRKMAAERLKEIEAVLGVNVDTIVADLWPRIEEAMGAALANPDLLALGALDMVSDLRVLLDREREYLEIEGRKAVDGVFSTLESQWKEIEGVVKDVVTDDGFFDRRADSFKLRKTRLILVEYLNQAELVVLSKARNELTRILLTRLLGTLDKLEAKLKRLVREDVPGAVALLDARLTELHTKLFEQAEAKDNSPEGVCSVNVMTQEWRDAYWQQFGLTPTRVLANLLDKGWHPKQLLELKSERGVEVSTAVAQAVVNLVSPYFDQVRRWAPLDVLKKTREFRGQQPEEVVASVFYRMLQPQMVISAMRNRLEFPTYDLIFCGGIDSDLKKKLEDSNAFGDTKFNVAENHEANRVNFFRTTMPIAMAGCDTILNVFEPEYNRWMARLAKMTGSKQIYERSLFHCFPKSFQWPSPTRCHAGGEDPLKVSFARALAVSEMLEPSEQDLARMQAVCKNPKNPRYALFQLGQTQFWLWPFFEPNSPASPVTGKAERLATNVFEAFLAFQRGDTHQANATAWVNWFEQSWTATFTSPQVDQRRIQAIATFQERKGKASDPRWTELWDELIAAVQGWELG